MSLISLSRVHRSHRMAAGVTHALDDLTLAVMPGDYVAVIGASASGKTSLLNMLALLEQPDDGDVCWDGQPVVPSDEKRMHQIRLRHISYVLQRCHLIERYDVARNVDLGLSATAVTQDERRARVAAVLSHLGLSDCAGRLPSQLSMGQQQCVAIARAAVSQPALLLADELTAHLDEQQARQAYRLLKTLNASGTAVILASHDAAQAAHAGRTIQLQHGRIVADSSHQS